MIYNEQLANNVGKRLSKLKVIEKKMFGGLTFMVNGKMCINLSGENLTCRFDPNFEDQVKRKKGYVPMIMKGSVYKG